MGSHICEQIHGAGLMYSAPLAIAAFLSADVNTPVSATDNGVAQA